MRTEEILDAAQRVLARTGPARASIELIAQEAGIAKGTVYLYFPNKRALLARASADLVRDLVERTRAEVHGARGPRARLRAIVRAAIVEPADPRPLWRAFGEPGSAGETHVAAYHRLVTGVLQQAMRSGTWRRVDAPWAAHALIGLLRATALEAPPLTSPGEPQLEAIVELFLHGIGKGDRR